MIADTITQGHGAMNPAEAASRAVRAAVDLGDALADLPLDIAREIVAAMLEAADGVRAGLGRPAGLIDVLCVAEPFNPDFLKSRDDWRRDLMKAWRALPQEDRAAFLARVDTRRAAA